MQMMILSTLNDQRYTSLILLLNIRARPIHVASAYPE